MKIKSPKRLITFVVILTLIISLFYVFASISSGVNFSFLTKNKTINSKALQNFVVAGVDELGQRTDLILFCQYNSITKDFNVLQIPRDTKVETKRYDKKINSAYGTDKKEIALYDDIENIVGIRPDKYVIVSFKAFRELIDVIGGVEVNVPFIMNYHDPYQHLAIELYPGLQNLDGKHAEMYMRFRMNDDGTGYKNGDIDRIAAQKEFYSLVVDKVLSVKNVFKTHKLLQVIKNNVKMDFTGEEILGYIGEIPSFKKENIKIHTLPGEGKYVNGISYFVHDEEKTKSIINQYFSSENQTVAYKTVNPTKNKFIKVEVINSTSIDRDLVDICKVVKDKLENHGFTVISSYNSDKVKDKSQIVDHNGKNASDEVLKIFSGVPVINDDDKSADADVTIYVGNDFSF